MGVVNLNSLVSTFQIADLTPEWNDFVFLGYQGYGGSTTSCMCNFGRNWHWWTVPTGVTCAEIHIWGAGGGGAGACCCQQTYFPPMGGAYAYQALTVTPGCRYQMSVGFNACCSDTCLGSTGCYSCICGPGVCICVQGGAGGTTYCCAGYGGLFSNCQVFGGEGYNACSCFYGTATRGVPGRYAPIHMNGGTGGGCDSCWCGVKFMNSTAYKPILSNTCTQGLHYYKASYQWQACGGFSPHAIASMASVGYGNGLMNIRMAGTGGFNAATCAGACCCGSFAPNGMVLIRYK